MGLWTLILIKANIGIGLGAMAFLPPPQVIGVFSTQQDCLMAGNIRFSATYTGTDRWECVQSTDSTTDIPPNGTE